MITTMFYYNYYKPYIFKAKKMEQSLDTKKRPENEVKQPFSSAENRDNKRLLLNKAFNNDVVSYAHNVSYNLTSLKDSAKYINYDIDDFDANEKKYGSEKTKEILKSDLEYFVDSYNNAYSFYSTQKHSQSLVDFSIDIDNTVIANMDTLERLGLSFDQDNRVTFSAEKYDELDKESLKAQMGEAKQAFESLYEQSSAMLSVPLAEHMNFKKLSYYYNYKYGGLVSDTFKIIESGLIIDKVV